VRRRWSAEKGPRRVLDDAVGVVGPAALGCRLVLVSLCVGGATRGVGRLLVRCMWDSGLVERGVVMRCDEFEYDLYMALRVSRRERKRRLMLQMCANPIIPIRLSYASKLYSI
jgi:hypothetical protein